MPADLQTVSFDRIHAVDERLRDWLAGDDRTASVARSQPEATRVLAPLVGVVGVDCRHAELVGGVRVESEDLCFARVAVQHSFVSLPRAAVCQLKHTKT